MLDWHSVRARFRNDSAKSILAVVVRIDASFQHGQRKEQRLQIDDFFNEIRIRPGSEMPYQQHTEPQRTDRVNESTVVPSARATVEFVEFEDGTFYGRKELGADLLDIRTQRLEALRSVNRAHERLGTAGFLQALGEKHQRIQVDGFLEVFRMEQRNHGSDHAFHKLKDSLVRAEARPLELVER